MAQERYLSPKEILSYLCDLENKLPKRDFKIYVPSHNHTIGEVTANELNNACQQMLDFVGMGGYKANARFAKLPDGTAGITTPGHKPDGKISIDVSDSMTSNWKAVLATLAHEICHHVIHDNFIRPNIPWMTETFTDLCTIYIGFGQLILDGYKTRDAKGKHVLGYLDWNTYEVTNHMVCVVCGGVSSKNTGGEDCDIFADEVLKIWETETDKSSILKKELIRQLSPFTDTLSKIEYFENLLSIYRGCLKPEIEKQSKLFQDNRAVMENCQNNKLAAFNIVYNIYCNSLNAPTQINDSVLESALYNLYIDVKKQYGRVVFEREFVCPCCGKRYKLKGSNVGKKIIKCLKCNTHFVVDTNEWNPTTVQRKEEQRRMEKRKLQEAYIEELRVKVSDEEKSAVRKENEQKARELKERLERCKQQEDDMEAIRIQIRTEEKTVAWREVKQLENDLKVAQFRENELKEKLDSLPGLLRWAVKRHIKKH